MAKKGLGFREYLPENTEKVFIFGMGGGNDIVSTTLMGLYLKTEGIKSDIGGVLSPGAIHRYGKEFEKPLNEVSKNATRYIATPIPRQITFVDSYLPGIVKELGINLGKYYNFSTRFGSDTFAKTLETFLEKGNYDAVIGIDVGGDVLARGPEDSTLLSPLMDFSSLYALGQMNLPSLMIQMGLGTDGELRPDGMRTIIRKLEEDGNLRGISEISKEDNEFRAFKQIWEGVSPIRKGHTITMTYETLKAVEDITSKYQITYFVGEEERKEHQNIVLPKEFFRKVFFIDSQQFASQSRLAFRHTNPLEQYVKLKTVHNWKTESDMYYLWSADNWRTPIAGNGKSMQLLVPADLISEKAREHAIRKGFEYAQSIGIDFSLVRQKDLKYLGKHFKEEAGDFAIVSSEKKKLQDKIADEVLRYNEGGKEIFKNETK